MTKIAACLALLVTACADQPEPVHGDLATFDGAWGLEMHCEGSAGRCDMPWPFGIVRTRIATAILTWSSDTGTVYATHRGDVLDGCLSVPAGMDGDLARDAYDLCPVASDPDAPSVPKIAGPIVWGRGTVGECHCDVTLRKQP